MASCPIPDSVVQDMITRPCAGSRQAWTLSMSAFGRVVSGCASLTDTSVISVNFSDQNWKESHC